MKKRMLSIWTVVVLLIGMLPSTALAVDPVAPDTSWYNESENSFTIRTTDHLLGLVQLVNDSGSGSAISFSGKTITLGADIDLQGVSWTPIGTEANSFQGTFDGDNHTISGLHLTKPDSDSEQVGLFGVIRDGTVKDLTLSDVKIQANANNSSDDWEFAPLAGSIYSSDIENVHVLNANIDINVSEVAFVTIGGLVGLADTYSSSSSDSPSTFNNCTVTSLMVDYTGKATHHISVGGLLGGQGKVLPDGYAIFGGNVYSLATEITDCCVSDFVLHRRDEDSFSSNYEMLGGIVGYARSGGKIENCHTEGLSFSVSAEVPAPPAVGTWSKHEIYGIYGGGIAGSMDDGLMVQGCTTHGKMDVDVRGGYETKLGWSDLPHVQGGFFGGITGLIGSMPEKDGWGDYKYTGEGATINNCFANIAFEGANKEALRHASALYATKDRKKLIHIKNYLTACTIDDLNYNHGYPLLGPAVSGLIDNSYKNTFLVEPQTMHVGIEGTPAIYKPFYNGGPYFEYHEYWEEFIGENGKEQYRSAVAAPAGGGPKLTFQQDGDQPVHVMITNDSGADLEFDIAVPVIGPITVKPVDVDVYMGGDSGYDGTVGKTEGGDIVVQGSSSLPMPGFRIDLPAPLQAALVANGDDITDLQFTSGNNTWKPQQYGENSSDIYQLVFANDSVKVPVPVRFSSSSKDEFLVNDTFEVGKQIYQTLTMGIYAPDSDAVTVTYENDDYLVDFSSTAELTVRGTTGKVKTVPVFQSEDALELTAGEPVAQTPVDTKYQINNGGGQAKPDGVALLFDEIIEEGDSSARTGALAARGNQKLGEVEANQNRHYQFRYLDLVDTQNGNMWVSAIDADGNPQNITVYWPLPEGTDENTEFTLLHFEGLHREMESGEVEDSIQNCNVSEIVDLEVTGTHVAFQVGSGGFSPFALVWETRSSSGGGGGTTYYTLKYESNGGTKYANERYAWSTEVELDKIPTREGFTFTGWYADADLTERITYIKMTENKTVYAGWKITGVPEWLNGEDHYAYVVGYPDGTIHPRDNITRAEVATIFYRLLKADIRDSYNIVDSNFRDVDENSWYYTEVSTMEALGILNGRTSDTFVPAAPITRAEFASICARLDTGRTEGNNNFIDVDGHWAEDEIALATMFGWITGYPDGTFRPDSYITRAEAMALINRVLQRMPEEENDLLPDMRTWSDNTPADWFYLAVQEATNSHDFERKVDGVHEKWTALTEELDWSQHQ